jgi:protein-S-isoprenylcysteine O-methyltransferase Ste14
MKITSILSHLRDIIILPFTVTLIVPHWIYNKKQDDIPEDIFFKVSGVSLIILGVSMLGYTIFLFGKIGKGTLAPWTEKESLVVAGPYRYCRNPMISGVLFILSGEALLFHSTNILIWAGTFFVFNTLYFIIIEEPYLAEKFGAEYREYKKMCQDGFRN